MSYTQVVIRMIFTVAIAGLMTAGAVSAQRVGQSRRAAVETDQGAVASKQSIEASLLGPSRAPVLSLDFTPAPVRPKPLEDTGVRLELFIQNVELAELEHDFDTAPTITATDTERDRQGLRTSFGRGAVGGFVQLFTEEFKTGALPTRFDNTGIGGGIIGHPEVGKIDDVTLLIPFKFELNLAVGIEEVSGFDEELIYAESNLEIGFGARARGVQAAIGVLVHSFNGLHESDNPSHPSHLNPTSINGVNIAGFGELVYKHEDVPVFGRFRATFGDVTGIDFAIGVAF